MFIALTFNTVMYENGEPLFKVWILVMVRECIVGDFDTCMRMFMEFIKDSSKLSKRKTDSDSITYDIWRRGMVCCRRIYICCV